MLGRALALHEGEVRADLMRYYGLSLDSVGEACSCRDAAAMVAHLPSESALRRAEGDGWSEGERLIASCEFSLRVLRWYQTQDGHRNRNPPRFPRSPREREAEERDRVESTKYTPEYMAAVAESLGIPEDRR